MVKFHESTTTHPYPFETVTLAYFLRYPNPHATHVLSTDVVSRHFDPTTQTLYTARLHLKKSKVPTAVLRLIPTSWLGTSSEGTSQSYILERTIVDVRDGVMVTESRNLEFTGVLTVVERQLFRRPSSDLARFFMEKYAGRGQTGNVQGIFRLSPPEWAHLWRRQGVDQEETDSSTKVELISNLGEGPRRRLWSRTKSNEAEEAEPAPQKMGFFRSWTTGSIQKSIEAIGLRRAERAVPNSEKGMNVVLARLRSGGLVAVLEGMRRDREMGFAGEEEIQPMIIVPIVEMTIFYVLMFIEAELDVLKGKRWAKYSQADLGMPHSTRRKVARPFSNKLVNVENDDGWSTVARKGDLRGPNASRSSSRFSNSQECREYLSLAQLEALRDLQRGKKEVIEHPDSQVRTPLYTLNDLKSRSATITAQWSASDASTSVHSIFNSQIPRSICKAIDKAICLGLGSPSGWSRNGKSLWQLAAFLDIVRCIKGAKTDGNAIQVYAQDPGFNHIDKAFLSSFDVELLDSPKAFEMADGQCVFFAPHLPLSYWSESMRCGRSGLIVGNDIDRGLGLIPTPEEIRSIFRVALSGSDSITIDADPVQDQVIPDINMNPDFKEFSRTQSAIRFPEPKEAHESPFNDTCIYWSAEGTEDG